MTRSALDVALLIRPPKRILPLPRSGVDYAIRCVYFRANEDESLDKMVKYAKRKGWRGCSASRLIRIALSRIDIDELIREHRKR